jgi:hypothetical protein
MKLYQTQVKNGRWSFLDPEGNDFLSIGVNCVATHAKGLPERYGDDGEWFDRWAVNKLALIRDLGFNTLAAWHESVYWGNGVPKTVEVRLSRHANKVNTDWGVGFPDVFDPSFKESIHKVLRECFYERGDALRDDPGFIGFYTDNELHWWGAGVKWGNDDPGVGSNVTNLVDDYFELPPDAAGKRAWVAYLEERYGDIETLNNRWNSEYSSFEDLLYIAVYRADDKLLEQDKLDFLRRIAEVYFSTTSSILKQYDPHHLNLGCRIVGISTPEIVLEVMKKYVDVVSINFYRMKLPVNYLKRVHEITGKPVMITEFSFCAGREAGFLYNTNGARKVLVRDQKRRGECYDKFVQDALDLPFIVGTHWFALYDYGYWGNPASLIGNYGLLNIKDEPYEEFAEYLKRTHLSVKKRFETQSIQ